MDSDQQYRDMRPLIAQFVRDFPDLKVFVRLVESEFFPLGELSVLNAPIRFFGDFSEVFNGSKCSAEVRAAVSKAISRACPDSGEYREWAAYWGRRLKGDRAAPADQEIADDGVQIGANSQDTDRNGEEDEEEVNSQEDEEVRVRLETLVGTGADLMRLRRCKVVDRPCLLGFQAVRLAAELIRCKESLRETQQCREFITRIADAAGVLVGRVYSRKPPLTYGDVKDEFELLKRTYKEFVWFVDNREREQYTPPYQFPKSLMEFLVLRVASQDGRDLAAKRVEDLCSALDRISKEVSRVDRTEEIDRREAYQFSGRFMDGLRFIAKFGGALADRLDKVILDRVVGTKGAIARVFREIPSKGLSQFRLVNGELPHNSGRQPRVWRVRMGQK